VPLIQVNLKTGEASVGWGGKEDVYKGAAINDFLVLCSNLPPKKH